MTAATHTARVALAATLVAASYSALAARPGPPPIVLDWWSIDGGGEFPMTGGTLEVVGTIGQPDAGTTMIGGTIELVTGFRAAADGQSTWLLDGQNLDFFNAANWADGGVPEQTDAVVFDLPPGPEHGVSILGQSALTDRLLILDGGFHFQFFDQDYTLLNSNPTTPAFVLGGPDGDTSLNISTVGAATQRGILAPTASIADGANSFAQLSLADQFATLQVTNETHLGRRGHATVNVSSGAELQTNGIVVAGTESAAVAEVTISGTGSLWDIDAAATLEFGRSGIAVIDILDGARLETEVLLGQTEILIGTEPGAYGEVRVSGTDSRWIEESPGTTLTLGKNGGEGHAFAELGGEIHVHNVNISPGSSVGGDGRIVGNLSSGGMVRVELPGAEGSALGTLNIDGTYRQRDYQGSNFDGVLQLRVQDMGETLAHDTLSVTGTITLGGGLIIQSIGDLDQSGATSLPIINAPARVGTFNVALIPIVSGDKFLNVGYDGAGLGGGITLDLEDLPFSPDGFDPLNGEASLGMPANVAIGNLDGHLEIEPGVMDTDDDVVIVLDNNGGPFDDQLLILRSRTVAGVWVGWEPELVLFGTGLDPSSVTIGHFDGDNRPDIAVAHKLGGSIQVYLSDPDPGEFGYAPQAEMFGIGNGPKSIITGQFTDGGFQDLAVLNEVDETIVRLKGDGVGAFTIDGVIVVEYAGLPGLIRPEDLDENRKDDIIHVVEDPAQTGEASVVEVYPQIGAGDFAPAVTIPIGVGPTAIGFLRSDRGTDSIDMHTHLVVTNETDGTLSVIVNEGNLNFAPAVSIPVGTQPLDVAVLDLEQDGDADLAVLLGNDAADSTVQILRNDQNGENIILVPTDVHMFDPDTAFVRSADLDGDGIDDLLAIADDIGGGGSPEAPAGPPPPLGVLINALAVVDPCPADLDGNDSVDVADLLSLLASWGSCARCPADINDDDVVDVQDLLMLLSAWGACPA